MFQKLASIKIFNKNYNDTTISIIFNKFIAALCDYKYAGRTPEALDKHTYLTLLIYLSDPVANLRRNIQSCERVENKGVVFTVQTVIYAVLDYVKVPVTIQSYSNTQSDTKAMGTSSEPKGY